MIGREFGIDYARVDGNKHPIDFKAAYAAGCRFAILRGSWGTVQDTIYKRDADAIRAAGMSLGAYMFLRFPTKLQPVADPETQARTLIASVGALEPGDLPVTLDVEFPGNGRKDTLFSARQAIEWCERAHDTLRHVYPSVMVYTSARVWHEDLADMPSKLGAACPLWIKTPYFWKTGRTYDTEKFHVIGGELPLPWATGPGCWFQQIQGDAVGVPGFSATVDVNLFWPLQRGERGARVRWMQERLRNAGLKVDGDFGPATQVAVKTFQFQQKLVVNGIVDLATFSALCS